MELEAVAGLINEQSPMVQPKRAGEATGHLKALVIWGMIIMFGAVTVGASLKILGKENIHPFGEFTPYVSVVALIAAIFGMGLLCYPFLAQTWVKRPSRKFAPPKPASTIKLLPDEQPSVTEQTTEFLESSEASRGSSNRSTERIKESNGLAGSKARSRRESAGSSATS